MDTRPVPLPAQGLSGRAARILHAVRTYFDNFESLLVPQIPQDLPGFACWVTVIQVIPQPRRQC
jgi:glutaredoxin-related protein